MTTYTHDGRVWRGDDGSAHEVLRLRAGDYPDGTWVTQGSWSYQAVHEHGVPYWRGNLYSAPTASWEARRFTEGDTVTVRAPKES